MLGPQGSGGGVLASILEQPVIVSGWGSNPGRQVHTGLPCLLGLHSVLGPQGLGSQGSGLGAHLECHVSWGHVERSPKFGTKVKISKKIMHFFFLKPP